MRKLPRIPSRPPRHAPTQPLLRPRPSPAGPGVLRPCVSIDALVQQCRSYAKSQSKALLSDLPQGALPLPPFEPQAPLAPKYPTVIAQARTNMDVYSSCILLTRVGGFYELYFEHAEEVGPRLGLKVTYRRTVLGPVSMAGFPFWALERVLKALVQEDGRYVAVAEEFPAKSVEDGAEGGLLWERRIARVITPGTLIDEKFVEAGEWNFLLAVAPEEGREEVGLAWLDLGTGDFFLQLSSRSTLAGDVGRIGPREIVIAPEEEGMLNLQAAGQRECTFTPHTVTDLPDWSLMAESTIPASTMDSLTPSERAAGDRLLSYLSTRLPGLEIKLRPPIQRTGADSMRIDAASLRGLEIKTTLRDHTPKGSLLHTINRTVTRSGARLLSSRLLNPATDVNTIEARLDLVETFIKDQELRAQVVHTLKRTYDTQRIVQKFSLGRGDADDLLALARTIRCTDALAGALRSRGVENKSITLLLSGLQELAELAQRIEDTIDEEGLYEQHRQEENEAAEEMEHIAEVTGMPMPLGERKTGVRRMMKTQVSERQEAWVMKRQASVILRRLHKKLEKLQAEKAQLQTDLQEQINAPNLALKWTPGLGHILYFRGRVPSSLAEKLPSIRSVSTSRSTSSYHLPAWTALGTLIDAARLRIRAEESTVFTALRTRVATNLPALRANAAILDALDVSTSLASLATELRWTRPHLARGTESKIIGGRHPTVEAGLREQGKTFVPNDLFLTGGASSAERLWLLTGPNMAGKSTFLRQNALITILAQTGSFVPASYAALGICDAVFSRVGSADNLFRDQSTFMVEMLETAAILRRATERSFVIMDEVGRGTTPRDGVAVAYAVARQLVRETKCRALFATHFHELAEMLGVGAEGEAAGKNWEPGTAAYCTNLVDAPGGGWSYGYKLKRGLTRESHALKVARLAGMPVGVIEEAEKVIRELENEGGSKKAAKPMARPKKKAVIAAAAAAKSAVETPQGGEEEAGESAMVPKRRTRLKKKAVVEEEAERAPQEGEEEGKGKPKAARRREKLAVAGEAEIVTETSEHEEEGSEGPQAYGSLT